VEAVVTEYGVSRPCEILGLARSSWYYQRRRVPYEVKHQHLREPLETVARCHPEYGYRRTTVELHEEHGLVVNRKVVQNLHQCWDLPLMRVTKIPKPSGIRTAIVAAGGRVNLVAQLPEIAPFEVAYTDFTDIVYGDGVAKLIAIIGHVTKMAFGWAVGPAANTELALTAWDRVKQTFQELGVEIRRMIVHQDQDPVFTGYGWTGQLLLVDGVRLSYTLNGAKDNTEMESFFSRFKNENRSLLLDAQGLEALGVVVDARMRYHNTERRHSTLDYVAPLTYVQNLNSRPTPSQ
jgi:putative transposase